jgi:Ca2+-binding RTX toxin-like protein
MRLHPASDRQEADMRRKALVPIVLAVAALVFTALAAAAVIRGTRGDDNLVGTPNSDLIRGFAGNDTILGNGGTDVMFGGPGNDTITGGNGFDVVYGQVGDDTIRGGDGADQLHGNQGNDEIRGKEGPDTIYGGPGNDTLYAGAGRDHLYGGQGDDTLWAIAADGDMDFLDCGPGFHDVAHVREGEKTSVRNCEQVIVAPDATTSPSEPGDLG